MERVKFVILIIILLGCGESDLDRAKRVIKESKEQYSKDSARIWSEYESKLRDSKYRR